MKKTSAKLVCLMLAALTLLSIAAPASAASQTIKKDRFTLVGQDRANGTFTMRSSDGQLEILIGVNTKIIMETGESLFEHTKKGTIVDYMNGKMMTVTYTTATKSTPAQTSPDYIVVHEEKAQQTSTKKDRFTLTKESGRRHAFTMTSADGKLVINVNRRTKIVFENGKSIYDQVKRSEIAKYLNGKTLTVTYGATTKSMPPQTTPDMIVVHEDSKPAQPNVKKARFNLQTVDSQKGTFSMISRDKALVINVNKDTPIYLENGQQLHGYGIQIEALAKYLDRQRLTVTYSTTTRSQPPQTSPEKIVINGRGIELLIPFFRSGNQ